MTDWHALSESILRDTGIRIDPDGVTSVGGGCINTTYRVSGPDGTHFIKLNVAAKHSMFEAERAGLTTLADAKAVRVPKPQGCGLSDGYSYLLLEWIPMHAPSAHSDTLLGERLAQQHMVTSDDFGWFRDNTVGDTPQPNPRTKDWVAFFRDHRLRFQLGLLADSGIDGELLEQSERLLEALREFFPGYEPRPALLHGDLWGGNRASDCSGEPVTYDPAVYFGDRECDVAMTELFGRFDRGFYAAYENMAALDAGYRTRRDLYNLYHILNHANLFGGSYVGQARQLIARLLAELG